MSTTIATTASSTTSTPTIAGQVLALIEQHPTGIHRDTIVATITADDDHDDHKHRRLTVLAAIQTALTTGKIIETEKGVYGWPAAHADAFAADDDEHIIRVVPGRLRGAHGLLLTTDQGQVWIPAECLPDLRRRLGNEQQKIERARA